MQYSYSPNAGKTFPSLPFQILPPRSKSKHPIFLCHFLHTMLSISPFSCQYTIQRISREITSPFTLIKQFFIFLFVFNKVINNSRQGFSIIKVALRQGYSALPPTCCEFLSKYSESATGKYEPIKLKIKLYIQLYITRSLASYCHLISSKTALLLFMSSNNGENYKI